jgi:glycosyltransferase involved in cell wall biosynthesis
VKVLEYMAFGKPMVSFDLKETRYSAGEAAVYVKPNDELAYAQAIATLMDDPERRKRMGAFGLRRMREHLSWQHVSRNLVDGYRWLNGDVSAEHGKN